MIDQAETMQEKADLISESCEYREQQKCLMDILGISQEKRNFETLKKAIENLQKKEKEKVNQEQPASSSRSQSRTRSRCQSRIRSRSRSRSPVVKVVEEVDSEGNSFKKSVQFLLSKTL